MPKRTSEGYGQVATEEPFMIETILNQVRNESVLRPPPLPTLAERAIREYGVLAGAMNPPRSAALDSTVQ
jgi:hypothetical protein